MKAAVILVLLIFFVNTVNTRKAYPSPDPDKKIFIITLDGFRWNEIFNGADSALIHSIRSDDGDLLRKQFWSNSSIERRKQLLPFLWTVIAGQGQVFGNRDLGNRVNVSNPYGLSFPGYSELLTGKVDLSIYNNAKIHNSNPNILEALNKDQAYKGKVAAFTSWNVFSYILNRRKGSFYLDCGEPNDHKIFSHNLSILNKPNGVTASSGDTRDDAITFAACTEYVERKKPSIVFLGFSGTDDAGHAGRYDHYLRSANRADSMIRALWSWVQSIPAYAGKTSFLITTDHGRGLESSDWHKHGFFVPGSTHTWMALLGPAVVSTGELKFQNQFYLKNVSDLVFEILKK